MDWLLNWYTFWGLMVTLTAGTTALWFLGLWPVIIGALQTPVGRKAILGAIGVGLVWVFSIFLYQRGKQNVRNEWSKAEAAAREYGNKARADGLRDAANPSLRDPNDRYDKGNSG